MKQEEKIMQWIVCGLDEQTMERDESYFQGVYKAIPYDVMGTIDMLKKDLYRQKKELIKGTHTDGYLIPWGDENEVLITQNGSYVWDGQQEEYKQVFINTIYEKGWFDKSFPEGRQYRINYIAVVIDR